MWEEGRLRRQQDIHIGYAGAAASEKMLALLGALGWNTKVRGRAASKTKKRRKSAIGAGGEVPRMTTAVGRR